MYFIDYINNKYIISIQSEERLDRELFMEKVNYLKKLYIYYKDNLWEIPNNRIDEILLWFERDKIEYILSSSVVDQLEKLSKRSSETKYFRNKQFNLSLLNKGIELLPEQIEEINWRLCRSNYLDSLEAGWGKTPINICVMSQLFFEDKIDACFITVRIGREYSWKYEILNFVNNIKEDNIIVIDNDIKHKAFTNFKDAKIIITPNHLIDDIILSYYKKKVRSFKNIRQRNIVDLKKEWDKQRIACINDEAHEMNNSDSSRSKALNCLKPYFDYRFNITATAWNRIEEVYNQINFLDSTIINMSENAFNLYLASDIGNDYNRYSIKEYNSQNVEKFLNSINLIYRKKLKSDIKTFKYKRHINVIDLQLSGLQKQLYRLIAEREILKLEEEYDVVTWKLVLNKLNSLSKVIDNPFIIEKLDLIKNKIQDENGNDIFIPDEKIKNILNNMTLDDNPKFIYLRSFLKNKIEKENEKVIVYCVHPENLDWLTNKFINYNPLTIHGSLKGIKNKSKDRAEKEYLFNQDNKHKLMLLSALTSSDSINLQKMCNTNIVYGMPWSGIKYEQLTDRTHRIVSVRDTFIKILCIKDTIDVIRCTRNINRMDFNSKMGKQISHKELKNLLNGIL